MFKKLLSKLRMMREERKYMRSIDLNVKKFQIRNELIKFYLDYDRMNNIVDIPPHYRAERIMRKKLRTPADIDRSYRKLLEYKQAI